MRPHHFKAQTHFFLSHRAERTFGTLLIAFLGYAIDGRLSSGSPLPACRNEWIRRGLGSRFPVRAGGEAIREDCPTGKEEGKKVLSSISTSFPRRWKSRPAQRITGANVSPTKKSSLTISPSFPAEPPLFAIRSTTSAFPFYNIPRRPPFQSLRKKKYQSNQSPI